MLITEHTIKTSACTDKLWAMLQPTQWHLWDPMVTCVKYGGYLAAGKNGKIMGKGRAKKFNTREVTTSSFTIWRRPLPQLRVRYVHELLDDAIKLRVEANGLLAPLAAIFYRKRLNKLVPVQLRNLALAAETA